VSKLEKLAAEYNVKILFSPKYHCETNPIEGYWCPSKQYIRKNTDQSFQTLLTLMPASVHDKSLGRSLSMLSRLLV
ncbi:unnamed protein product, partial [Rotaria magnacalcarata]